MKRTVYDCDRCHAQGLDRTRAAELLLAVDWEPDPAGGPAQCVRTALHLCVDCIATILLDVIDQTTDPLATSRAIVARYPQRAPAR
jgi:hypothetical protein